MSDILHQFKQMGKQALADLARVKNSQDLESFRLRYLSRKGEITRLVGGLGSLPQELRADAGKLANQLKREVQEAFGKLQADLQRTQAVSDAPLFDVTLPGRPFRLAARHVIMQTIDELVEIFGRMGFEVGYGPEIEDEYHNFIALNIDEKHPARDPLDNFYVDEHTLLRSQTSTMQIRVMETRRPPIRVVAPGRVYRPDSVDATHMYMFYQLEALAVDEGVTMVDLKTTIDLFIRAFFGEQTHWRFRPSFFPFTEPSGEVDLLLKDRLGNESWVEMGGCGMVDPNVFEAVGYDPERYTGWAFGFGIERLAMRKFGIPDIRWFFENDLRFLKQF
ncbi:MAG: phenylalanine--tRNA ligase subunit alpha [Sedimentisphaerales bacterium]|nr:phenylalanine--tRNA ligase subunit alpha [Sedimentisphaerales bacterium]